MNLIFENQVTSLGIVEEVITLTLAEQGIQGVQGTGNNGRIAVAFSYGDATPVIIYSVPAGKMIFSAQIVITQIFNGVLPSLRLGDSGNLSRFLSTLQNSPLAVGAYSTSPNYTYGASTDILLSIVAGSGATQGAGFILLEAS